MSLPVAFPLVLLQQRRRVEAHRAAMISACIGAAVGAGIGRPLRNAVRGLGRPGIRRPHSSSRSRRVAIRLYGALRPSHERILLLYWHARLHR